MNKQDDTLSFCINGQSYLVHSLDPLTEKPLCVGKDDFQDLIISVKGQCFVATELLISQLDKQFPNCEIMEALGVTFLQF